MFRIPVDVIRKLGSGDAALGVAVLRDALGGHLIEGGEFVSADVLTEIGATPRRSQSIKQIRHPGPQAKETLWDRLAIHAMSASCKTYLKASPPVQRMQRQVTYRMMELHQIERKRKGAGPISRVTGGGRKGQRGHSRKPIG